MMAVTGKFFRQFAPYLCIFIIISSLIKAANSKKSDIPDSDQSWKKKDVRDYTDADLERLYDQWEEDDDPLEEDELPEHLRPQTSIDMSKIDPNNPEGMIQMTKKGRTLMMFATVSGDPKEGETEEITRLWQSSLFNANYEVQRYIVGSNRALFMLKDGSKAFEVKNFLVTQERCEVVTIEGQDHYGKGSPLYNDPTQSNKSKVPRKKSGENQGINDIKVEL